MLGIEALASIAALQASTPTVATAAGAASATPAPETFATLMRQGIAELDASVAAAEGATRDLAAGKSIELHDVMISLERAQISVQTFIQLRNKLVESYQDLMRMQI